jgi:flagellar biosynthesis/type III secretory pathway M-ring protein FliF/YscJ
MRTDTPSSRARLRSWLAGARRRLAAQGAATRLALAAAVLAAAAAVVYAATLPIAPGSGVVRGGLRFSSDDLITIGRALSLKQVRYRVNDLGQIEVAADKVAEADEVVAKLPVGPQSLASIDRGVLERGLLDPPDVVRDRAEQARNARLATMIGRLNGVVSAWVDVKRPPARGFRPAPAATAFVYLETENDRELGSEVVESIQAVIAGAEPEVKPGAMTIVDRKGHEYLRAHDPAVDNRNRTRAYRDELRQEIQKNLDWLKGAQVSVQVDAPPPLAPIAAPLPTPSEPAPGPVPTPAPTAALESTEVPSPSMVVNQPLELAPDPAPTVVEPPPAPTPTPTPPGPTPVVDPTVPPRVRVWVQVPRSFYLKAVSGREVSPDDLQPLVKRTEDAIRMAVKHVVKPDELDEVAVSMIPDEMPARESSVLPEPAGARRDAPWWVPAAVAGAATAAVFLVAFRVASTRRPAPQHAAAGPGERRGRYKLDEAPDPGPGPSARVRELIRLSPEAAASVLNRWTQGGTTG